MVLTASVANVIGLPKKRRLVFDSCILIGSVRLPTRGDPETYSAKMSPLQTSLMSSNRVSDF